jgi:hypothetical protein
MRLLSSVLALLASTSPSLLFAVSVTVSVTDSHCGDGQGYVTANPSGGLPPYTYVWSTGSTAQTIGPVPPGDYTVTVTDGLMNTAQATGTVSEVPNLYEPYQFTALPDCEGLCSGWTTIDESSMGGTAPYTYDWISPLIQGGQATFMGTCALLPAPLHVEDANGCTGDFFLTVNSSPMGFPSVGPVLAECGNQSNGSMTLVDDYFSNAWYHVVGNGIDSIYAFNAAPYVITGLPAGAYGIELWDPNPHPPYGQAGVVYCTGASQFQIPSIAEPCGSVSGKVYHDADQNCTLNGSDLLLPYRVLTIEPGPAYAITDGNGQSQQNLAYGAYTLGQTLTSDVQLCPAQDPVPFSIDALTPTAVIDLADSSTIPHDVSIWVGNASAMPGFPTWAWVEVRNNSAYPSGALTITLTFDPLLQNTSTAQWTLPSLAPFGMVGYTFHADVPADIGLLGSTLSYSATVTNPASEVNTANNTAGTTVIITGSYDPNDKQGRTSSGLSDFQYFLDQDADITYTVRFQNTGTAAASTVVIRDTIDADLDLSSLEIIGASHAFTPSFGAGRELVFTFTNINLPDSGADFMGSQGSITYRIAPRAGLLVGEVLNNTAGLYCDFNPPVITNTVSHVVELSTAVGGESRKDVRMYPNPAQDVLCISASDVIRSISVIAADGRSVIQQQLYSRSTQLSIGELPAGSFTVLLFTLNGERHHERLIKY